MLHFFLVPAHPFPSLWFPDHLHLFIFSTFYRSFPVLFQFLWMSEKKKAAASQPQLLQHTQQPRSDGMFLQPLRVWSPGECSEGCWLGMPPFQLWMLLVAAVEVKKARSGTDAV